MNKVKIYASQKSWIEGDAIRQLEQTADLPGMISVAGMPDLHPGKGCAVGAVSFSHSVVYPHLIGNDKGCGYTLFQTDIPLKKAKPDRLADLISGIDNEWDGSSKAYLESRGVVTNHIAGLGTVGGGNHFAELQRVVDVIDNESLSQLGVDPLYLVLLVHSGSRSLGEALFWHFAALCGNNGFLQGTEIFDQYIAAHNDAVKWASANRALIGKRLLDCLGAEGHQVADLPHNFVEQYEDGFLHRKGAAPANQGISPLPGSRGTPTYLLKPLLSNEGLCSLAHGAGRKASRSSMHSRLQETSKQLSHTALGSVVVCGEDNLLREEHQSAYKNVDRVLDDLKENGLADNIAVLHPVMTYKSERKKNVFDKQSKRDKEESWRRERRNSNRNHK